MTYDTLSNIKQFTSNLKWFVLCTFRILFKIYLLMIANCMFASNIIVRSTPMEMCLIEYKILIRVWSTFDGRLFSYVMYVHCKIYSYYHTALRRRGGLYVLARHHRMCKLANWSNPSNITSCSRASVRATGKQAKQLDIHMRGESST
jgi:hypothetical protein